MMCPIQNNSDWPRRDSSQIFLCQKSFVQVNTKRGYYFLCVDSLLSCLLFFAKLSRKLREWVYWWSTENIFARWQPWICLPVTLPNNGFKLIHLSKTLLFGFVCLNRKKASWVCIKVIGTGIQTLGVLEGGVGQALVFWDDWLSIWSSATWIRVREYAMGHLFALFSHMFEWWCYHYSMRNWIKSFSWKLYSLIRDLTPTVWNLWRDKFTHWILEWIILPLFRIYKKYWLVHLTLRVLLQYRIIMKTRITLSNSSFFFQDKRWIPGPLSFPMWLGYSRVQRQVFEPGTMTQVQETTILQTVEEIHHLIFWQRLKKSIILFFGSLPQPALPAAPRVVYAFHWLATRNNDCQSATLQRQIHKDGQVLRRRAWVRWQSPQHRVLVWHVYQGKACIRSKGGQQGLSQQRSPLKVTEKAPLERPARLAVQTEWRWRIASDHHRHRFCTVAPGVQNTISRS